jgi:hypothetical protein
MWEQIGKTRARANLLDLDPSLVDAVAQSAEECWRESRRNFEAWGDENEAGVNHKTLEALRAALDALDKGFERAGRRWRWGR